MTQATPRDYWISPSALFIECNALGMPDFIQASCTSGAQILVYIKGIIDYDAGHNYQRWPLVASPTAFGTFERKYVYAAVPRDSASGRTNAVLVYPSELIDLYGNNEAGEAVGSEDYYYIFLQGILSSSGDNGTINRVWEQQVSTGYLSSDEAISAGPSDTAWYSYSTVDSVLTFLKDLTMKAGTKFVQLFARTLTIVSGGSIQFEGEASELDGVATSDTDEAASNKIATPAYVDTAALSKRHDDRTSYNITMRGLTVEQHADVFGNQKVLGDLTVGSAEQPSHTQLNGDLSVGTYNKGVQGAHVDFYGNAEFESIVGRSFLEVPELRYNRTTITVGNKWQTVGAGIIEQVWNKSTLPDLFTSDLEGIGCLKLEAGEVGAIAVDDKCQGVFHISGASNDPTTTDTKDGNFHFAGFKTIYFLVKEILTADTLPAAIKEQLADDATIGEQQFFRYELRAASCAALESNDRNRWTDATHPQPTMHFAAYANATNSDRQASRLTTTTYQLHLAGMTEWTYTEANIRLIIGWLDGFAFLQNVWNKDKGEFEQVTKELHGEGIGTGNIYMWGSIDQFDRVPQLVAQQLYFRSTNSIEAPEGISVDASTALSYDLNGWQRTPITPSAEARFVWQQWLYTYSDGTYKASDVAFHASDPTALTAVLSKHLVSVALSEWYDENNPDDVEFDVSARLLSGLTPLVITQAKATYGGSSATTLTFVTTFSDDGLTVNYHITLHGFVGVEVDGATPEDAFVTLTLHSDYGTGTAVVTLAENREGEDGEPGAKGDSAFSLELSASAIVAHQSTSLQKFLIGVSAVRGSKTLTPTTDYTLTDPAETSTIVDGLTWSKQVFPDRMLYTIVLAKNAVVNTAVTFSVTDTATKLTYSRSISFSTVADGPRGYTGVTVRRSEWAENTYYRNDSADDSTADDGNRYLDEVSVTDLASGTAKWYLALATHNGQASSAANKPTSSGNTYWQPINDLRPLRTSFADIMTAVVNYLQVNQIQVTDDNGQPYGAFGGGTGMDYPLWFGGTTPATAAAKFDRQGNAWLGQNFSVVGNVVDVTGIIRPNAIITREGSIITKNGRNYLNLAERTGNYFVLNGSGENYFLPDPADYDGMQVTVVFASSGCGISCDSWLYVPVYRSSSFQDYIEEFVLATYCLKNYNGFTSLTFLSTHNYANKSTWMIVGRVGTIYKPAIGATPEAQFANALQETILPDGRIFTYVQGGA